MQHFRSLRAVLALGTLALVLLAPVHAAAQSDEDVRAAMAMMNAQLETLGADVRVEVAEFLTVDQVGRTVFFSDRGNKQLSSHFVPNDPRRAGWSTPDGITFILDEADTSATVGVADATPAIRRAMATWEAQRCSAVGLTDLGAYAFDFGYVQALLGFGGVLGIAADLTHAGWLDGAFFDALAPGGSNFILGVTFTFNFVGGDTNNDGRGDTAFREIYYNDTFLWNIGARYDVETIALHEAGHGLSQGHFGEAFRTPNGKLHFNPRAVMNAAYSGVQQSLRGTDKGGHCSNWGNWPNR